MLRWDPQWVSIMQLSKQSRFPVKRLGDIDDDVDAGYVSAVKETRYFKMCEKLSGKDSKDIMMPVPPMDIQIKLAHDFRSCSSKARSLEAESESLLNGLDDMISTKIADGILRVNHSEYSFVSNLDMYVNSWDVASICRNRPFRAHDDAFALKDIAMVASIRQEKCLSATQVLVRVSRDQVMYEEMGDLDNHDKMQIFYKGDVLLSRFMADNKISVWFADCDGVATMGFLVFKCDGIIPEYMTICLRSKVVQKAIADITHGKGVRRLRNKDLMSIKLPIPPRIEQLKIAKEAEDIIFRANVIQEKAKNVLAEGVKSFENAILR